MPAKGSDLSDLFTARDGAIQGYEAVHMIRKGQVSWLPKGDVLGLLLFLNQILGLVGWS